jgi:hypothetical protein
MTDVPIEKPASGGAAGPRRPRRPRAATTAGTTTTRRRSLRGADLIESLRESVEQLIKENRLLKRQLAKATAGGGTSAMPDAERTLRSIQRKVMRAVGTDGSARRRTRTATTGRRRTSRTSSTSRTSRTAD